MCERPQIETRSARKTLRDRQKVVSKVDNVDTRRTFIEFEPQGLENMGGGKGTIREKIEMDSIQARMGGIRINTRQDPETQDRSG